MANQIIILVGALGIGLMLYWLSMREERRNKHNK